MAVESSMEKARVITSLYSDHHASLSPHTHLSIRVTIKQLSAEFRIILLDDSRSIALLLVR